LSICALIFKITNNVLGVVERIFYTAREDEVVSGKTTDIYFVRTVEVLKAAGLSNVKVRAEFHVTSLPRGYKWAIFTGLKEVINLVEKARLPITIYAMPEGTLFFEDEPLMIIEGRYVDFAIYETTILGILRHYSSISTKAARLKKLARNKLCVFFGARVVHPVIQPMVDRAAYLGGCDAVAGVLGAELLKKKPIGTMPHALMIIFKQVMSDHTLAWAWFDKVMPSDVPRYILVDTFYDEREETLMALNMLKDKLQGIRLDTPSSRRGKMEKIVKEIKWTLKVLNQDRVKIIVSGGIDEDEVVKLRDLVDIFGIGTSIAFPPSIDISMDIVEVFDEKFEKWIPITKRGKMPGAKQVYRCLDEMRDEVTLLEEKPSVKCRNGSEPKPLLKKYVENGRVIEQIPSDDEIRNYVLTQLEKVEL